jgi:hypothetical protein
MFVQLFLGQNTNGASTPVRVPFNSRIYTASLAGTGVVSATVTLQGSDDAEVWLDLGSISLSGTDSATGSTAINATSPHTRAVISLLRGTGAAVTCQMESTSGARRVSAHADAATVTPDSDTTDVVTIAALSQATLIANPTGTPADGQMLEIRITSADVETLTYGDEYRESTDVELLAATAGSDLTQRMLFEWNAASETWDLLATNVGH